MKTQPIAILKAIGFIALGLVSGIALSSRFNIKINALSSHASGSCSGSPPDVEWGYTAICLCVRNPATRQNECNWEIVRGNPDSSEQMLN